MQITSTGPRITIGNEVVWTYVVKNTGETDLRDVVVTDDKEDRINCPKNELAVNESMTCRATGIASVGQYENESDVVGYSVYGNKRVDDMGPSYYIGILPAIDINKMVEAAWTYHVTNTGEITLTQVRVDGGPGVIVQCQDEILNIGASTTYPAEGPLECFENTALVTAQPEGFTETLTKTVRATSISDVTIQTKLNGQQFSTFVPQQVVAATELKWSFEVYNNGVHPLERITVTHTNLQTGVSAPAACPQETLAVDASMICTAETIAPDGRQGVVASVVAYPTGQRAAISDDTLSWVERNKGAPVGGHFFVDKVDRSGNANGQQDPTESTFTNDKLQVELYRFDGTLVGSAQLASQEATTRGQYQFKNLHPMITITILSILDPQMLMHTFTGLLPIRAMMRSTAMSWNSIR